MRRIICLIILVIVISGISVFTIYTLKNKGIREDVKTKINTTIEKVSSNTTDYSLNDTYNVYLNKEKHKVKVEFIFAKEDAIDSLAYTNLILYFDGKMIFEDVLLVGQFDSFSQIIENDDILSIIGFNENNFKILNSDKEYLLISINYYNESITQKYFIFNDKGDMLTSKEGIISYNSKTVYISNDNSLDYYNDSDKQVLARINKDVIYSLEEIVEKNKIYLKEYKYSIKDGEIFKELVSTYENIKLKK